jgi:hypothetical protein
MGTSIYQVGPTVSVAKFVGKSLSSFGTFGRSGGVVVKTNIIKDQHNYWVIMVHKEQRRYQQTYPIHVS